MLFALWPIPLSVYVAEVLHGFSSCTLGPVIAAISLAIAGPAALGLRLGRNARFASIGNGVGAALMGACGYYLPEALRLLPDCGADAAGARRARPLVGHRRFAPPAAAGLGAGKTRGAQARISPLFADRRLLIFALSAALFTFANAAMLPLVGSALTKRAGGEATLLIAACIVLPQIVVALLSPSIGRLAERRGRRMVLLLGFSTLPLRGLLFAVITDPTTLVLIQALDGIAGACFGVMVPLVTADIAGRSGHFNLALGFVGFAIGIGATVSTTVAGWIADRFGEPVAFSAFAFAGVAAVFFVWAAMPETRPPGSGRGLRSLPEQRDSPLGMLP